MFGLIKYGDREPDAREEEGAAEGEDDMERVVGAVEKTVGSEDEEGVVRGPFPVVDCLSKSEPAEGKMLCRSASPWPGV